MLYYMNAILKRSKVFSFLVPLDRPFGTVGPTTALKYFKIFFASTCDIFSPEDRIDSFFIMLAVVQDAVWHAWSRFLQ